MARSFGKYSDDRTWAEVEDDAQKEYEEKHNPTDVENALWAFKKGMIGGLKKALTLVYNDQGQYIQEAIDKLEKELEGST